jgi:uncharacterized glyoxalase superfamily protein PhnB
MAQPDMIGMAVRDMAAALKFYRLLGLDIPAGAESEDHVEIHANGYRLAWDTIALIKGFNPDWNENPTGQRMTLAFKCENAAEVDALYQKVLAAGYGSHKAPWDAFWGQRYAVVIDPDGNMVDLFATL